MHNIKSKYYFIDKIEDLNFCLKESNLILIYRNYNERKIDIKKIIKIQRKYKTMKIKLLLSNNFKLALKLNLNGAYIPSFNKQFYHLNYKIKKNFMIIGSAHNLKQIRQKELQGVHKIILSSLFKKNKNYLGINKFKNLAKQTRKEVIVLGGIEETNIKKLSLVRIQEFAGISFLKKKAPKKGPFKF